MTRATEADPKCLCKLSYSGKLKWDCPLNSELDLYFSFHYAQLLDIFMTMQAVAPAVEKKMNRIGAED